MLRQVSKETFETFAFLSIVELRSHSFALLRMYILPISNDKVSLHKDVITNVVIIIVMIII